MFGRSVTLFRMFGFAIRVDASWLIIAVLIAWSLASGLFPHLYHGLSPTQYWTMGILGALLLFFSIIVHELAHSLVARRNGLAMKGITLFIFGGVAEMDREPPNARSEFLMAIAGPVASIVIGAIFYMLALIGRGRWPVEAVGILSYLGWINWILAAFNMIPAFPLDGGRVLRSALWHWKGNLWKATRIASTIGSGFGIALVAFGVYRLLVGDFVDAVWWFLIGMFLRGAAQASYQQLVLQMTLQGEPVKRFMNTNPISVPPAISLEELVEDYVFKYHFKMFPVVNDAHQLLGYVSVKQLRSIPRDEWARNSVQAIMQPYNPQDTITPDTDSIKALAIMKRLQISRLMVVQDGRLVAVLALKDLLHFLTTKLEMEEGHAGLTHHLHP